MTLLTPIFGLITALIVVPLLLLLYMLKLRRERRDISSTLLWTSHTKDLRANSLFQRLRLSPLFVLQCLLLLMLAAALTQPILKEWSRPSGRVVFLIDQSASMQTRDAPDSRTRLDEAKRLAIAQVVGLCWIMRSPIQGHEREAPFFYQTRDLVVLISMTIAH